MKGKTVLVVAHRLSTIRSADVIVVMGREIGNVIEKGNGCFHTYRYKKLLCSNDLIQHLGTHNELMKKRGVYYGLHNNVEMFS